MSTKTSAPNTENDGMEKRAVVVTPEEKVAHEKATKKSEEVAKKETTQKEKK